MTPPLSSRVGLGGRELVSIVGAGGKSSILRTLGAESARRRRRVILTTTTKMATDQIGEPVCDTDDPRAVAALLQPGVPLYVIGRSLPGKVTGLSSSAVDGLFANTDVEHLIVEADGARSMAIKAPAPHEPVLPGATTLVIVVAGMRALGLPIVEVAHRPEVVARLVGVDVDHRLGPDDIATVVLHPEGGLKDVPPGARVVVALVGTPAGGRAEVREIVTRTSGHPAVEATVLV